MIFHDEHSPSILAKISMSLAVLLGLCSGTLTASEYDGGNSSRVLLIFICSFLYFVRFTISSFVFIQRKIAWLEAGTVSFLFFMMFYYFTLSVADKSAPLGLLDFLGVFFFLAGSWVNLTSDFQKYSWKRRPINKGRLYTLGMFRHAMHINYFGDNLSYLGLALITHHLGCLAISIGFVFYFVGFEIPRLDKHLSRKYEADFANYSRTTKKFIPFVY